MRDVDDRAAFGPQRPDDPEQLRRFARRQRTRRFVECDHARVAHQRLADLDHLPLTDRQILYLLRRVDFFAEPFEFAQRARNQRLFVKAMPKRFGSAPSIRFSATVSSGTRCNS